MTPITDERGRIMILRATAAAYTYDPHGVKTTTTPPPFTQPFNYTAAYTNPTTGLLHLSARYYDPTLGRFTQQDPQTHPGDTNQSSPYPYTGDDPINNTDPSGLGWLSWTAIGIGLGLLVAAVAFPPVAVGLAADVLLSANIMGGTVALGIGVGCQIDSSGGNC